MRSEILSYNAILKRLLNQIIIIKWYNKVKWNKNSLIIRKLKVIKNYKIFYWIKKLYINHFFMYFLKHSWICEWSIMNCSNFLFVNKEKEDNILYRIFLILKKIFIFKIKILKQIETLWLY